MDTDSNQQQHLRGVAIRGLSKGSTYRFNPEIALELEVYGMTKKFGSKNEIIERSLAEFFRRHPVSDRIREAALLILGGGD